ncbi:MAG TPA: tetratricopeptide repeat protein [Desulfonatronum sp.]|nr:tetratricopeptide repeat protein [Desulfonatronum sp.]
MHQFQNRISPRSLTRRDFLWLTSAGAAGLAAGAATGCAVNPVTGQSQLMFFSEENEVQLDQEHSPHQFSSDYGPVQDERLNAYLTHVGSGMAANTHRPHMPYSFRCVNANHANAYVFPGGSVATTRGILLEMQNEAELAGLIGHELGHVNARHTSARMSTGILASVIMAGATIYLATQNEKYAAIAAGLGGIASGALLAHYSRNDERQADALGMEYMTRSEYSPDGMVGLMDVLRNMSKSKPSAIEMMFSTHPMSEERYQTAVHNANTAYADARGLPVHRERYMDSTAELRKIKDAIEKLQEGEKSMMREEFPKAESAFEEALQKAPEDYAGLVLMAKCQLAQERPKKAAFFAEQAQRVYPSEAQGHHLSGLAKVGLKQFDAAYAQFDRYERMLPGNPNTVFLKGFSQEGMGHKKKAAEEYYRYLQSVDSGEQAQYAYNRLLEWGFF